MNVQDEIISLIFKITRQINKGSIGGGKRLFSIFQIKVMGFIDSSMEPTMKDIADNFCVTCPSATAVIERLVELENVRRIADASDRRTIRLALTEKGKTNLSSELKIMSKDMEKVLSKLTEKEKNDLKTILGKITNN